MSGSRGLCVPMLWSSASEVWVCGGGLSSALSGMDRYSRKRSCVDPKQGSDEALSIPRTSNSSTRLAGDTQPRLVSSHVGSSQDTHRLNRASASSLTEVKFADLGPESWRVPVQSLLQRAPSQNPGEGDSSQRMRRQNTYNTILTCQPAQPASPQKDGAK